MRAMLQPGRGALQKGGRACTGKGTNHRARIYWIVLASTGGKQSRTRFEVYVRSTPYS